MNVMLQRHAAKYIYVVPDGLKELMSDISREVLRTQPQNLYIFIADYLEALLLTRENARVAARLVQSITEIAEATIEFLETTGMERPQVDRVVSIIHETFKKRIKDDSILISPEPFAEEVEEANIITDIINEADIGGELAEEAARIIQNAYKKFKHRKEAERQLLTGMIDWRIAARSAIKLYRQTGVTNEEVNRAATLIKAAYKGYYTRRIMKQLTEEQHICPPDFETQEMMIGEPEGAEIDDKHGAPETRSVTIDYDTVIPHVDFGDVTDLESPGAVIGFTLEKVVDNVMIKIGHPEECKFPPKDLKTKDKKDKKSTKPAAGKKPKGEIIKSKVSVKASTQSSKKSSGTSSASGRGDAAGEPASTKASKQSMKKKVSIHHEDDKDRHSVHSTAASVQSGQSGRSAQSKGSVKSGASKASGTKGSIKSEGSRPSEQSEVSGRSSQASSVHSSESDQGSPSIPSEEEKSSAGSAVTEEDED